MKIPAPKNLDQTPDPETQKGLTDQTAKQADNRVLYVNLGIIRFGSNDKVHAASFIFSIILLVVTIAFYIVGFSTKNTQWAEEAVKWAGNTFLFVAGIVLGKSSGSTSGADKAA